MPKKSNPRVPRKKGQHRGSSSHSDLYTDENPKGTIKGLKFATVKDAKASVAKIKGSGKTHAHKIQAAVAMEQRAKEMGKVSAAGVYRTFINKMKEKTKKKNEDWTKKQKKSVDCNNPKGFSQKAHCAGRKARQAGKKTKSKSINDGVQSMKITKSKLKEMIREEYLTYLMEKNVPTDPGKWSYYKSQAKKKFDVYPSAYANAWAAKMYKKAGGGWRKTKGEEVKKKLKSDSVPYGGGYKKINEAIQYHLDNNIPFHDNIFRMYSANYFRFFNEARKRLNNGLFEGINAFDHEMLRTDIGKIGIYEGKKVFLDVPFVVKEAEYQGKKVDLNSPKRGGSKKFYVYVKDGDKVKKVAFGAKGGGGKLAVKLKDPDAVKSFVSRHDCKNKNDKTKPGYWACRLPRYGKALGLKGGGQWW